MHWKIDILTSGVPMGKNSLKKAASLVEKVWHRVFHGFVDTFVPCFATGVK